MSAEHFLDTDAQLKGQKDSLSHYLKPASDASIAKAVEALKSKHGADVIIAENKADALKALIAAIPAGASISAAGSTTLTQIGYDEWAKTQKAHRDYKAESLAAQSTDQAASADLRRQGLAADVFFSSVTAISEEGELYAVDLTGTRTGGFLPSKRLVLVVGHQKIVPDHGAILKRTQEFCLALESARVRVAYGIPGSQIVNTVSLAQKSPFSPAGRLTVIIVKETLGF